MLQLENLASNLRAFASIYEELKIDESHDKWNERNID